MAKFDFDTGSDNIDGKIEYSYTRNSTSFTVSYSVYMRRNNTYNGTPSSGTINYEVYISNSVVKSDSVYYKVPNDKNWELLVNGTKNYKLSALNTGSFTVGFKSTANSGASSAFNVAKQTSKSIAVSAYATNAGKSSLNIAFTKGDNYYTFSGTIGKNGTTLGKDNNNTTGCRVYYTTDGTNPTTSSSNFTITGTQNTSWSNKINITKDQKIKAIAYTLAPYGNIRGTQQETDVYYYSPPSEPQNLIITWDKSKPTPKAQYKFSWSGSTDGYNNTLEKYCVEIKTKTKNIQIETTNTYVEYSGKSLSLQKGEELQFTVCAQGNSDYNNLSQVANSLVLEIVSAGIVKIKIDNQWKEGQVWIKRNGVWIEASEIYIKKNDKWNSSV